MKFSYICLIPFFIFFGCSKKKTEITLPPPKVKIAKIEAHKVPIFVEAVGHFTAYNEVEIKAQVEGILLNQHFKEGRVVQEGELLYTIDPRPYEAQLQENIAALHVNQANLKFALDTVKRNTELVKNDYVSQLQFDEYESNVAIYRAEIEKNEAAIQFAKINLDYCYIKAPVSGVAGIKKVDVGNLIANDGSTMIVVNQIDPIYVDFLVTERDLLQIKKYQSIHPLKVNVEIPGSDQKFQGELTAIDNMVTENVGMIPLRGTLKNADHMLWPGQFVRVKLILYEDPEALLILESALNIGQKGRFCYVVNGQNKVEMRMLTLGERIGNLVLVKKGLKAGDRVITNGQFGVKKGDTVEIVKKGIK